MVPLRLFLGLTFVYAGLQKVTDAQFFNPTARGFIGRQIAAFANGSPLHDFLLHVALPNATFFGAMVVLGELAIGICVLWGLFLRPAAFFGAFLNLILFLSADWRIYPYFYGSDIVFIFCWITLLIAGPSNQILPALDTRLVFSLVERAQLRYQRQVAAVCAVVFGVKVGPDSPGINTQFRIPQVGNQLTTGVGTRQLGGTGLLSSPYSQTQNRQTGGWPGTSPTTSSSRQAEIPKSRSRRSFISGAAAGGGVMLALAWLVETLRLGPGSTNNNTNVANLPPAATPTPAGSPVKGGTPRSNTPVAGETIAKISDVPTNKAFNFTLPSSEPGILIHLNNGQFVAYNATCTHAGCPVDFDGDTEQLLCPCHGAIFNPARAGEVISGPAQTPLATIPILVDRKAGKISFSQ